MKLTKIKIEGYKSIKSPVTISFVEGLPTVLIGKNGSGKTNILEALSAIFSSNNKQWNRINEPFPFHAYFLLSEKDVKTNLPDFSCDKRKWEVDAYSDGNSLKIDRVHSEYIMTFVKKEIDDIRGLASQLKDTFTAYKKQISEIFRNQKEEKLNFCYEFLDSNGKTTNYFTMHHTIETFIKQIENCLDAIAQAIDDETYTLISFSNNLSFYIDLQLPDFKLEYVKPALADFEKRFISIDEGAIKQEIERINKDTEDSCKCIKYLFEEIKKRVHQVTDGFDTEYILDWPYDQSPFWLLREVQHVIGKRFLFLKNESYDVLFRKEDRNYYYNDHSNSIMETYLRQVYDGSDREELLKSQKDKLNLSEQALADFEEFLNKNIPSFDKEMYESISVQADENGRISILLNEKTGEKINLNETSAGRRWYFTYYFMKNVLNEGDIFIIDEPAAMLHPSAQREVLCDLMKLTKRGVKVVYSTHSPYLIPDEWQCVHFITMTEEGTEVNCVSSNQELVYQMKKIVGEDIFDVQTVFDMYTQGDPIEIGRKCYNAVRNQTKDLEEAASKLFVSVDTIKSWNRNGDHFRRPKLENIIAVCNYTNIKIKDLLN